MGVRHVAIPRNGKPGAARRSQEAGRRFRRLLKWRTGCEGRISHLKRTYGWDRTLLVGLEGARIWCGWGILAHNTRRTGELATRRDERRALRRDRTADPPDDLPPVRAAA